MPTSSTKKQLSKSRKNDDIVTTHIEFPDVVVDPVPVEKRKRLKLSKKTLAAFAAHDPGKDDPDAPVLPPSKWAHAMRREEFFRPIKKQTTVRIDADVLDWLKSKGEGHISRVNEILRRAMLADRQR